MGGGALGGGGLAGCADVFVGSGAEEVAGDGEGLDGGSVGGLVGGLCAVLGVVVLWVPGTGEGLGRMLGFLGWSARRVGGTYLHVGQKGRDVDVP